MAALISPLHVFRFHVDFFQDTIQKNATHSQFQLCSGAFAECTGLEATIEPKIIKEGGWNYGAHQRAGVTTFTTVVLKRGISKNQNLYQVFNTVATATYAARMQVTINLFSNDGNALLAWQLDRAMPIKYKFSDLNAKNSEIGIEELHLAHEGLWSVAPTRQSLSQ